VSDLPIQKATFFHACQTGTSNSVKQHRLRKLIAWLSDKEGRGKEFISLYIPPEETIDSTIAILKRESDLAISKSENINDRLQEALKSVIQHIKNQQRFPENGLAIFAGALISDSTEEEILSLREIVPPEPITEFEYAIDNHFQLEPLREMLREQRIVGVIVLDSKEAGFGILNGDRLELIENITSGIPGKSGKGGQSQRRYEREREMELTHYFHRIAEHATKAFLENRKVTVLVVGGPGPTKDYFLKGDYLHYELANVLLNTVDTQFAGTQGVKEALAKSSEELKSMCAPEQKRTVQQLLAELGKQHNLATYGLDSVLDSLKKGEAEVALVTDNADVVESAAVCKRCGLSKSIIMNKKNMRAIREMISSPCARCGAAEYEVEEKDIVDVLEDVASQTDARVEVISAESEEKAKLTALGGFAALLRFRSK